MNPRVESLSSRHFLWSGNRELLSSNLSDVCLKILLLRSEIVIQHYFLRQVFRNFIAQLKDSEFVDVKMIHSDSW